MSNAPTTEPAAEPVIDLGAPLTQRAVTLLVKPQSGEKFEVPSEPFEPYPDSHGGCWIVVKPEHESRPVKIHFLSDIPESSRDKIFARPNGKRWPVGPIPALKARLCAIEECIAEYEHNRRTSERLAKSAEDAYTKPHMAIDAKVAYAALIEHEATLQKLVEPISALRSMCHRLRVVIAKHS